MEFKKLLKAIGTGKRLARDLTREEAAETLRQMLNGTATPAQIGGFFLAMRVKGESPAEFAGFTDVARATIELQKVMRPHLIEVVPPYDGKRKSPWVLPAAALAASAAGAAVSIHSEEKISPKFGLSVTEVFRELGVKVDLPLPSAKKVLEETGIVVLLGRRVCPSLYEKLIQIRLELNLRTIINNVEKFVNPFDAPTLMVSVFHGPYLDNVPPALRELGVPRAFVLQGEEGSTDCYGSRATKGVCVAAGQIEPLALDPSQAGLEKHKDELLEPYTAPTNAAWTRRVLEGEKGAACDLVVWNAAVLLQASGRSPNLTEAATVAADALDSGKALEKLKELAKISHSL